MTQVSPHLVTATEFEQEFKRRIAAAGTLSEAVILRSDCTDVELKEWGAAEWTNALLNILLKYGQDLVFRTFPNRRYFTRGSNGRASNSCYDSSKTDPSKVLIFGFQNGTPGGIASFDDIVSLCRRAAEPLAAGEEYILFGWPADATWANRMATLRTARFGTLPG